MCCIVLEFYYLCVVIGDKPVRSYHKFLKYSTHNLIFISILPFSFSHDDGIEETGADQKV